MLLAPVSIFPTWSSMYCALPSGTCFVHRGRSTTDANGNSKSGCSVIVCGIFYKQEHNQEKTNACEPNRRGSF